MVFYTYALTQNRNERVLDTPICITYKSKTLIDQIKEVSLSNLSSQIDLLRSTILVLHRSRILPHKRNDPRKPEKISHFSWFLPKILTLWKLWKRLLSFFPSDYVDDHLKHLLKILKQTNKIRYCKSQTKNCSWFNTSSRILLKKRKSLYCELVGCPNEPKFNKY